MKIISQHRALVAFAVAGLAVAAAQAQSGAPEAVWQWHPAETVGEAVPPLPPPSTYPVQLVLDDDSSDGAFGVAGQTARQFLWFNRFSPAAGFHLDEVWVLFPSGANMTAGGAVQIAIYEDPDGDPTNGANLVTTFNATIQAADDNTFSIYPVAGSPVIPSGSDLLVGVVPRFIVSGVTPPTFPAAVDTTASQNRSWVAAWSTDPPDPPVLVPVPDQTLALVDTFVPGGGNFMIRAFGTPQPVTEIPTLGGVGLAFLALALLAAGALLLRRRGAAAALALLTLALAAPAGAVTIDSFTTNQAAVSDPPGTGTSVTGGADIIGTRRGLVPDLLLGAGPATASVAGGNLALLVTATTPDSRGAVLVSWDGDTNPAVLSPTGLGNANLTTGNASGFRLDFVSTTVVTEVEITVYDDAANFSRAARRVAAGGAQSVSIPFAEFRVAGGTGAVFSSVGAIEMTLRSGEGTATLSEISTTAPTVAATKVDTQIVDTDGDTRVDPGDRVRYTVTVTNTGNEALAVDLTDTVDANTTLVAGSVSSTPVAHNDQYGWFGNVAFATDGSAAKPYLLDNDEDADGDTLTVQSGTFPATTAAGGAVTLVSAATGEFTYSPPAGFAGVDSFNYTVVDDNGNTSTATANIALKGVIWFVDDSNTTAPFLGTFADPFQNLFSVNNGSDPDQPGDTIFVYDDDGTPYAGGLVLEADQTLLGEAAGLVLDGTTIVPVGGRPQITNAGGNGLTLATNNTLGGFDIQGTSAFGITGSTFGTLTASNVNVLSTGTDALNLQTGNLAATFGTLSSAGAAPGRGLAFFAVTGSLTATTTSLTNPTIDGIVVSGSPGVSLNFGTTTITDNAIGSGATGNGVNFNSSAGASLTFSSLAVTSDGGTGLRAIQGTINIGGTGNSIVSTGGPAVDANSTSFGSGATFATLSSTNSPGKGINLDTITGPFTATGGSISNATGTCFDLNGGAGNVTYSGPITCTANALLVEITGRTGGTVTLSGNLSSTSNGNGINVSSNTGGTINFSGATKTLTTGADAAVTLATNTGATINFTGGGLAISTTSGNGFDATGGATAITVQGAANTITSTTGMALNVTSTNIGASGLNFQSISAGTGAGSAGIGINLDATGLAAGNGGLTVAGTGSAGSGGTIQHKTGANNSTTSGIGVFLKDTKNTSLSWMQLNDFDNSGIVGRNVQGFTLLNSVLNGVIGTDSGPTEGAINFGVSNPGGTNGLQGAGLIRNTRISGSVEHNLEFYNQSGLMNLTIDGTTAINENNPLVQGDDVADCIIEENSVALGGDGIQVEMQGTAIATVVVDRCLFRDNKSQAVQVAANDSSALTVTIDECFTRKFDQGNEGFLASNGSNGDLTLMYSNNQCSNTNGTCFFVGQTPGNATSSSFLNATIANNVVNMPTTATNHGILVFPTSTIGQISTARLRIDGNIVTNNSTSGVARGILVDTPDTSTSPKFDVTVTNNTVSVGDNVAGVAGLVVQGRQSSDVCANIGSNTVTFPNGTPGGVFGLRARQANTATYDLEQTGPCSGGAATVLACRNPASTTEVLGTLTPSAAGSCLLPSVP